MHDVASAVVRPGIGRSDVHRARGAGPLRLLCPRAAGGAGWIVTSSLGGGLVDGDAVALEVYVAAGATAVVTTQASTKVYKGRSQQRTHVVVEGDGTALVVPDPVVPYRDATFAQITEIELAREGSLALCDVLTAGRVAYGERWSATRLETLLRISIDGTLVIHDRIVLDHTRDIAAHMQRFTAIATVILVGPRVRDVAAAQVAALDRVERSARVIVAGSPLAAPCHRSDEAAAGGVVGAVFRIAGEAVEAVVNTTRDLLREACSRVGEDPWSRKW